MRSETDIEEQLWYPLPPNTVLVDNFELSKFSSEGPILWSTTTLCAEILYWKVMISGVGQLYHQLLKHASYLLSSEVLESKEQGSWGKGTQAVCDEVGEGYNWFIRLQFMCVYRRLTKVIG